MVAAGGALESAAAVEAGDAQLFRVIGINHALTQQFEHPGSAAGFGVVEGMLAELNAAPGAGVDRDWLDRGVATVVGAYSQSGGAFVVVSFAAHAVGSAGLAHPESDLKRPATELVGLALSFELQGADQSGSAAELVKGEQAQGVAHQYAQPAGLQ